MAIKTATNFEILDSMPIDTRFVVNTEDDLASLKAYEGLEVYVKSSATKMRYDGTNWTPVLSIIEALMDGKVELLMPRRLKDNTEISLLPATANKQEVYLFVDNNGEDAKMALSTLASSTLLRTVSEEPNDLQVGEYIFLQI